MSPTALDEQRRLVMAVVAGARPTRLGPKPVEVTHSSRLADCLNQQIVLSK